MLFFYMIILLLIFVIQFSVACACLGVDEEKELTLAQAVSTNSSPHYSVIWRHLHPPMHVSEVRKWFEMVYPFLLGLERR